MAVNSNGMTGYLGIAKTSEIRRSPGSGCTQALAYHLLDFLLGISHRRRQLWSPELSESVDCRCIHQLDATCKTNKKTTVVFRPPSDGKVSLFSEDLELRAAVLSIQDLVPFFM